MIDGHLASNIKHQTSTIDIDIDIDHRPSAIGHRHRPPALGRFHFEFHST